MSSSDDAGLHKNSLPQTTRVYAHCTSTRSSLYKAGAVTVFALNISPSSTSNLAFSDFSDQPIDVYVLSPAGPEGVLSKSVLLNSYQKLELVDDHTLPIFKPDHLPPGSRIALSPLTLGFFVFPSANASACLHH
jgi:hypothetical protein